MWPFSVPSKATEELESRIFKLEEAFRLHQRDLLDLDQRYRRLRALQGGEARVAALQATESHHEAPVDSKQALRDKYLPKPRAA
jgi:hypothetical protein